MRWNVKRRKAFVSPICHNHLRAWTIHQSGLTFSFLNHVPPHDWKTAGKTRMEQTPENIEKPKRSPGRIIARNTAFGFAAQIALRAVSFLFGVLIVHRLGTAEYGQYNIVLAWTGLFSVLGDLGITQYFTREIAREPQKTSELFWDMVVLRGLLAVLAAGVTTAGAILHPYSTEIVL